MNCDKDNSGFKSILAEQFEERQKDIFAGFDYYERKNKAIPGSAAWIVENNKKAEMKKGEALIDEVSADYPALGRIYKELKGR